MKAMPYGPSPEFDSARPDPTTMATTNANIRRQIRGVEMDGRSETRATEITIANAIPIVTEPSHMKVHAAGTVSVASAISDFANRTQSFSGARFFRASAAGECSPFHYPFGVRRP